MKKINIIKKNEEFCEIIKKGKYCSNKYFTIYLLKKNKDNYYRFGISIGKKAGNAVNRNKIKRQLRNIIDNYKYLYENGDNYIIIVKKSFSEATFSDIEKEYNKTLEKIIRRPNE